MREFLAVAKALADRNRLRALMALKGRRLCVCQIVEFLGLAPSTVSKHMAILRQAGLVEDFKEGRWVYYRAAGAGAGRAVREALAWSARVLAADADLKKDVRRIKAILKVDPGELCR